LSAQTIQKKNATKQLSCTEAQETSKRKPNGSERYTFCNKFHGGECWNKNKAIGKQQGQANKALNRTFNKPPRQRTYSITER
jgi:hypothetical protein